MGAGPEGVLSWKRRPRASPGPRQSSGAAELPWHGRTACVASQTWSQPRCRRPRTRHEAVLRDWPRPPDSCRFLLPRQPHPVGQGAGRAVRAHPPGSDADIAQQLQNPIASLISVPFQNNFDFGAGPRDNGFGYTMNFQPVVPFRLSDDWTLITRTIIPFIHQERYTPDHETGLGDTTQSFFFSPRSGVPGLTWGVGPAVLWPTATRPAFQSRQWGLGPTGVRRAGKRPLDRRPAREPPLGRCRLRQSAGPPGPEPDIPAALRLAQLQERLRGHRHPRVELRLDRQAVDAAARRRRQPAREDRPECR